MSSGSTGFSGSLLIILSLATPVQGATPLCHQKTRYPCMATNIHSSCALSGGKHSRLGSSAKMSITCQSLPDNCFLIGVCPPSGVPRSSCRNALRLAHTPTSGFANRPLILSSRWAMPVRKRCGMMALRNMTMQASSRVTTSTVVLRGQSFLANSCLIFKRLALRASTNEVLWPSAAIIVNTPRSLTLSLLSLTAQRPCASASTCISALKCSATARRCLSSSVSSWGGPAAVMDSTVIRSSSASRPSAAASVAPAAPDAGAPSCTPASAAAAAASSATLAAASSAAGMDAWPPSLRPTSKAGGECSRVPSSSALSVSGRPCKRTAKSFPLSLTLIQP
mmetsp:Transcript_61588/g.164767  ORF Transcript_61588/g.164767 Transcript_61588/m.164767 type:complete len:337 (-) Transcript_61588:65-1075(-)